jgi:hypothetical protein
MERGGALNASEFTATTQIAPSDARLRRTMPDHTGGLAVFTGRATARSVKAAQQRATVALFAAVVGVPIAGAMCSPGMVVIPPRGPDHVGVSTGIPAPTVPPPSDNPVGALQEYAQACAAPNPEYRDDGQDGPPHARTFRVACAFGSAERSGSGPTKADARRRAAAAVLEALRAAAAQCGAAS